MDVKTEADIKEMKEKKNKTKQDKYIIKLAELYLLSQEKWGAMSKLKSSLGLFENYCVRGVNEKNPQNVIDPTKEEFFEKVYENENVWTMKWLIDPDKKRKAIRKLFKWEYFVDGNSTHSKSPELRQLKRIVNGIDLADFFDGNNRSKWKYGKFNDIYKIYIANKEDPNKAKDANDNVVVLEWTDNPDAELYYNAVFDVLVNIWEWGDSIVESINAMKVSQNVGDVEVYKNENWYGDNYIDDNWEWKTKESTSDYPSYSGVEEKTFILGLADYDNDGIAWSSDGGVRMWMQIKNTYKDVKLDQMSGVSLNDTPAWLNIVEFAKVWLKRTWKGSLLSDLESLLVDWTTPTELNEAFKTNWWLKSALQGMLANSPIPVEYIYRYGAAAGEKYLTDPATDLLSNIIDGSVEIDDAEVLLDAQIKELARQWLNTQEIPKLKSALRPMFYGALMKAGGITTAATWVGLALDIEKTGTFSLNLWYTEMPGMGGWPLVWTLGVMMSWGNGWKMSKNTTWSVGVWVGAIWFVPVASGGIWIKALMNANEMEDASLQPKSAEYFKAGAGLAIVWWVLIYGAWVWVSKDKMEWIDRNYQNIKQKLSGVHGVINRVLDKVNWGWSKQDAVDNIKNEIASSFRGAKAFDQITDKDDQILISKAAENMYRGLSYYNISSQLTDGKVDEDLKITIVHDMIENYALQWRNAAVEWIIDDTHISGAWVWVSFLAWFVKD